MLALAQTAERFKALPSDLIRLSPLELDFNLTCNYRLIVNDIERQQMEIEAMEGNERPGGKIRARITEETVRW